MARPVKTFPKAKIRAVAEPAIAAPVMSAFSIGDAVSHSMFGDGDVTDVQGDKLTIAFHKFGIKHVLDGFVKRR